MEQIDDCCHRFERLRQQRHQRMCTIQPTDRHIPTVAFQSLDTVRALHQTVVSLRKALEDAHREIDTLKKHITVKDDIEEGKRYREQEEISASNESLVQFPLNIDLSTITNSEPNISSQNDRTHFESNKSHGQIKTSNQSTTTPTDSIKHETKAFDIPSARQSTKSFNITEPPQSSASSHKLTTSKHSHDSEHFHDHTITHKTQHSQVILHPKTTTNTVKNSTNPKEQSVDTSITLPTRRTPQMASKIDVKIKLISNFQIDSNDSSSETTGDSNSGILFDIFIRNL